MPGYESAKDRFAEVGAQVLGVSVDHVPCLKAWADNVGGVSYPLLSDFWPHGDVARSYSVFREADGFSERAIFVIDAGGMVRYTDVHDITELPDIEVLFAELAKLEPAALETSVAAETAASASGEEGFTVPASDCIVYCRSWCGDCHRALTWLEQKGIPHVVIDIEEVPGAADRVMELAGHIVTPTFEIGDTVVVNFDPGRLEQLLSRD